MNQVVARMDVSQSASCQLIAAWMCDFRVLHELTQCLINRPYQYLDFVFQSESHLQDFLYL